MCNENGMVRNGEDKKRKKKKRKTEKYKREGKERVRLLREVEEIYIYIYI